MTAVDRLDEALRELVRGAVSDAVRDAVRTAPPMPRHEPPWEIPVGGAYLSTAEAAAIAKVRPETIRRWVNQGAIAGHHAGRLLRVRADELHAFLARVSTLDDRPVDVGGRADAILNSTGARKRSEAVN